MPNDRYLLCPQRESNDRALFTQLIALPLCEQRQREGYHKCPRCLNRTLGMTLPTPAPRALAPASAGRR